jgi:hypothetical protein
VIFGDIQGDYIFDGPGIDTIYGGRGNDIVVLAKDGTSDTVTCGPGHDVVYGATAVNSVSPNCEQIHVQHPRCQDLPQRVPPAVREPARC